MKKFLIFVLVLVAVAGAAWASIFYFKNLRGIWPALIGPSEDISKTLEPGVASPLKLPPGFSISIFAKDLPGARVMARDRFGNFWVSQTSEGTISFLEVENGRVVRQNVVFKNLRKP